MSLQIWLPLNGNLHNQGLSNITTSAGANCLLNTNGKIGKCLSATATSNNTVSITLSNLASMLGNGKTYSLACWVKATGVNSDGWVIKLGSNNCGLWWAKSEARWVWNENDNGKRCANPTISSDYTNWHHLVTTIDKTDSTAIVAKHYVDGMPASGYETQIWNNGSFAEPTGTIITLYPQNALLNDIRLYDHVLSPKEVEEISKGLVLHYKLDNDNNAGYGWLYPNGERTIIRTSNNTFIDYAYYPDLITSTDTSYTADFYAKGSVDDMKIDIYFRNSSGAAYIVTQQQTLTKDWQHYSLSLSGSPNALVLFRVRCYGGTADDIVYIRDMKLLSNNILIRNDIIYDSSGYNNNGTIIGSLAVTASSQRYSYATKFANGQYIRVNNRPTDCMPKDAITVNLWQYATSWSNPISCTEGGGWNFESSSGIRFPIYISGVGYKIAQSSITPASTQNTWHMLTGTMDKDNIKIYYDGEEVGTIANGSTNGIGYANNYIFIGAEAQGDNTSPANSSYAGNLSDVRIYATALTPEQIKELYDTSMTVDNYGNIYARELVE